MKRACLIVHDFEEMMRATAAARFIWIWTEADQTLAGAIDPQIEAELSVLNATDPVDYIWPIVHKVKEENK